MPAIKSPTLAHQRQPFSEFLSKIDADEELTNALQDVVYACTTTGKPGSLSLTLKVKPIGTTGQVELDTDVKCKAPTEVRAKTLMFSTTENNLQRENPKQKSLEGMRSADEEVAARAPARAVEDATPQALRAV